MAGSSRSRVRGFSLLELAVVLLVVGILALVGVVAWGKVAGKSHEVTGSSTLDRVGAVEAVLARQFGAYSAWPADLADVGGDVTVVNGGPSAGGSQVSVAVGSDGTLGMAVLDGGTCVLRQVAPLTAGGASSTPEAGAGPCSGAAALSAGVSSVPATGSVKQVTY